jgi:hypothetical protein
MKSAAIENFAGIGNRLEVLVLARLLQEAGGGEVLLDWPEWDALRVPLARKGRLDWFRRALARRVRHCGETDFEDLARTRWLLLRCLAGPEGRMRQAYLRVAAELRLREELAREIQSLFASLADRPVIGLHVRRGDFTGDPNRYTTRERGPSPPLPLTWLAAALRQCRAWWPGCAFFLAASGHVAEIEPLIREFDLRRLPLRNPYPLADPGHAAEGHPLADLFALACCEVMIATPLSSFSHFAANALGPATLCLVPPQDLPAGGTTVCQLALRGQPLSVWSRTFRDGAPLPPCDNQVPRAWPLPRARTDWIQTFKPA